MAHQLFGSLFGLGSASKVVGANSFAGSARQSAAMVVWAMVLGAASSLPAAAQNSTYVPPVVASSVSQVPTTSYPLPLTGLQTNLISPQDVAVDSCGNIYAYDHGYDGNAVITEIPAGGGFASIVNVQSNTYGAHMGQDESRATLVVAENYSTAAQLIPLANCVPLASQAHNVGGGNGALFYYYNPGEVASDFLGNVFITTNGTCCVTGSYYLVEEINGTGNILLSNQPNELLSPAIDKLENVYFITGAAVYELPYSGGKYAAAPVPFGQYINPVGLSVDTAGNLYVADSSAGAIYEIPNEAAVLDSKGNVITPAGLNLADQFVVSSGLNVNVAVAVNGRGDMYYTANGASSVSELTLGNANFNAVATGQSATRILNFQFNAAATLTNIQAPAGAFTIQPASPGTTACVTGIPYAPTTIAFTGITLQGSMLVTAVSSTTGLAIGQSVTGAGIPAGTTITAIGSSTITLSANATASTLSGKMSSLIAGSINCQITVGFAPSAVGKQSSAIVLTFTIGSATKTINAFVEGIGQGALLTLDPGTLTPAGSGFHSPAGVAVDHAGNAFVADIGNNSVTEFPAGGGAGIPVTVQGAGVGNLPLSAPAGVAVDGAGDVFIADTGNNRVVEVPFVNGALSSAASTVIASGLKSPASVFVHTNGDLYIADTGDNTILVYPSFAGTSNNGAAFGAPTKLGVGLSAPLAVTVDGAGNVYIADSGNNQILEYPLGAGQEIVAANILNPSALATDSSGSLFVVDQGNYRVLRIPSVKGTLNPNGAAEVGLGVASPYGLAVDASSNLYVTDKTNAAAYTIARSQIGLAFGDLAVGTTSTALPLTVESAGNLPLVFNTPYFVETGNAGDFAMTSPTGVCANGLTLATGNNCDLATTFMPTVSGSRSATVAFASNATNTPQVTLTGTGVSPSPTTTTLALIPSVPGAPFYGEPLSFTATIAPTTGTGTPTGVVSFVLDGTQIALLPVVKGVATLQLNSGLSGGSHAIYAAYKGDTADNASSSSVMTVTIARAPTTPTLTVTKIPYNNPYSLRHSNTGSCNVTDADGNTNAFPAIPNDALGLSAAVTSPGVGVPSGTLTFYSDGNLLNGTPNVTTGLPTSSTALLPSAGGVFSGNMSSDANTLGDGTTLGENNVLVGPHNITVVYSGDQNYLPSTSVVTVVTVVDVSPTTPVILPLTPVSPAPYCDASSTIKGSRPADPSTFSAAASSTTINATGSAPGTTVLTISSLGGWTGTIEFSCPDLPMYTTCTANPGQASISSSTPGQTLLPTQVVITVTTNVPPYVPTSVQGGIFWLTSVVLGLLTLFGRSRFRKAAGRLTIAGFALLLFGGLAGFSGCGTGSTPSVVTPAGSYAVHVVLTGAQTDPFEQYAHEMYRSDVPYPMAFTLNVK